MNEVVGFLVPDGRFVCPHCDPPTVYQYWTTTWAQYVPQDRAPLTDSELSKFPTLSTSAWILIAGLSLASALIVISNIAATGEIRCLAALSITLVLVLAVAARRLAKLKMRAQSLQLSTIDLAFLPLYVAPSFFMLNGYRPHELMDYACVFSIIAYQLSFAALSWSYFSDPGRKNNILCLMIGAYIGAAVWIPMAIIASVVAWGFDQVF